MDENCELSQDCCESEGPIRRQRTLMERLQSENNRLQERLQRTSVELARNAEAIRMLQDHPEQEAIWRTFEDAL